ncbi:AMP-binding protein [Psychroflexus sp. YR1-1]|uniref:AMP-binding protein n=1 Tax=Psychroflexus aurantiacus TaxID=2709310 RepID=A0A6B3R9S3_9FLAO|nr:AMP-binding protein [Psychroflexus aurantiacus]NEV94314.1 AMP-binding protein [Psychroflexus aurantiacus]
MIDHPLEVHPLFKINGQHFNRTELYSIAYSYVKEGEPFEEPIGNFLLDWLNDDYDSIKVRTSGSTGDPKTYFIDKQKMVNSALATGKFFKANENTTALLCLPADYIGGRMMLVRAITLGWDLDIVEPKSNPLDALFKTYDFCAMTPFQVDNSLGRLHLIKKLIIGGGAVSENLIGLIQGIPTKVFEVYGMTETISHIAARKLNPKTDNTEKRPFKALPGISVSQNENNCLVIKAPKILDHELVTNDIVDVLTYKKFFWKGRLDNVINSGGIKIFPETLEKKLQKLITHRFFIAGLPHDSLGEQVVLFIEAPQSDKFLSDIREAVDKLGSLDKYEKPKHIYLIDKFEETGSGKINRKKTLAKLMS